MSAIPDDRVAEIKAALERGEQLADADRDDLVLLLEELVYVRIQMPGIVSRMFPPPGSSSGG